MTQWQGPAAGGAPFPRSFQAHDQNNYFYPPVPPVRQPPATYVYPTKQFSEDRTAEQIRGQSSVSSVSGSSALSYQKQHTPSLGSQWYSPTLEQTLADRDHYYTRQSAQGQPAESIRVGHSHKQSELTGTNSPAHVDVRERRRNEQDDEEDEEGHHAIWVWFWLACLDPLHSLASCLFTFFVTFGLVIASPIRLVHKQGSFGDQIVRTLAPLFKHHLDMIYASSVDYAFEWDFRPGMLIFIQIVSPLISVGVSIAAWVTGAFWVFTSIMGNPDGTERGDDGADAVLAIRNWWEKCLLKAIRPKGTQSMRSVV